jgi:hypothetical protein
MTKITRKHTVKELFNKAEKIMKSEVEVLAKKQLTSSEGQKLDMVARLITKQILKEMGKI